MIYFFTFYLICVCFLIVMLIRNTLIYKFRGNAIDKISDFNGDVIRGVYGDMIVYNGKSYELLNNYDRMLFNFKGWNYEYFYGNLDNDLRKYYGIK